MNEIAQILDRKIDLFFLFKKETLAARFKMRMQYFFILLYIVLSSVIIFEILTSVHIDFIIKLIAMVFAVPFLIFLFFNEKMKFKRNKDTYAYLKKKTINMFAGVFEIRRAISKTQSEVVLLYFDEKLLLVSAIV